MQSQYTGSAGKITNCQIGVFAAYVSRHGPAFIDRASYLPKVWMSDPARLAAAHVPEGTRFSTKPELALAMIERAIAAEVPFAWVAADTVYGAGDIEWGLRRAGKGYVLGVKTDHAFHSWIGKPEVAGTAEAIADRLPASAWTRLSAGEGTKGARLYDWAYCELADLDGDEYGQTGLWTRGLLIRRSLSDGERAYFTTWCPAGADHDLGRRRGAALEHRGRIRDRQDRTRARSQRDALLARLAPARQPGDDGLRPAGGDPPPCQCAAPKKQDPNAPPRPLIRWSVQEIRRIAVRLAQRRIQPAHVVARSLWRRAHQAAARQAHLKRRIVDAERRRRRKPSRASPPSKQSKCNCNAKPIKARL